MTNRRKVPSPRELILERRWVHDLKTKRYSGSLTGWYHVVILKHGYFFPDGSPIKNFPSLRHAEEGTREVCLGNGRMIVAKHPGSDVKPKEVSLVIPPAVNASESEEIDIAEQFRKYRAWRKEYEKKFNHPPPLFTIWMKVLRDERGGDHTKEPVSDTTPFKKGERW